MAANNVVRGSKLRELIDDDTVDVKFETAYAITNPLQTFLNDAFKAEKALRQYTESVRFGAPSAKQDQLRSVVLKLNVSFLTDAAGSSVVEKFKGCKTTLPMSSGQTQPFHRAIRATHVY